MVTLKSWRRNSSCFAAVSWSRLELCVHWSYSQASRTHHSCKTFLCSSPRLYSFFPPKQNRSEGNIIEMPYLISCWSSPPHKNSKYIVTFYGIIVQMIFQREARIWTFHVFKIYPSTLPASFRIPVRGISNSLFPPPKKQKSRVEEEEGDEEWVRGAPCGVSQSTEPCKEIAKYSSPF